MAIEVVFEKHINNASVYRNVDVEQRRQNYLVTGLAILFGVGLLFYGWQQYRWIQLGYDIQRLEKQKDELLEYQKKLVLELEFAGRDELIDAIARKQLGMVIPAPGQIVMLSPDDPATTAPEDVSAPLSAANFSARPPVKDECSEDGPQPPTSGGSPAERCQEAR